MKFLFDAKNQSLDPPETIDTIDNFATYTELILGIQQLNSMVELNLMLQYSRLYKVFGRND